MYVSAKDNKYLYKTSPGFEPTTFLIQVNTKWVFTPKTTVPWLESNFVCFQAYYSVLRNKLGGSTKHLETEGPYSDYEAVDASSLFGKFKAKLRKSQMRKSSRWNFQGNNIMRVMITLETFQSIEWIRTTWWLRELKRVVHFIRLTPSFFKLHSWRHPGIAKKLCML